MLLTMLAVSCRSNSDDNGDKYVRDVSYQGLLKPKITNNYVFIISFH